MQVSAPVSGFIQWRHRSAAWKPFNDAVYLSIFISINFVCIWMQAGRLLIRSWQDLPYFTRPVTQVLINNHILTHVSSLYLSALQVFPLLRSLLFSISHFKNGDQHLTACSFVGINHVQVLSSHFNKSGGQKMWLQYRDGLHTDSQQRPRDAMMILCQ